MNLELGPSLILRNAVEADLQEVRDIAQAAYQKYVERIGRPPGPMYADYAEELQNGRLYVTSQDRVTLGFAVFGTDGDEIYIDNLAIRPQHQSKGVGVSFLDALENWGRDNSMYRVRLFTHALMHENIRNYQVAGFQMYARVMENGFDRVYMQKCIAAPQTFPYFFENAFADAASVFLDRMTGMRNLEITWNLSGARLSNARSGMKFGWLVLPGHGGWNGARDFTIGFDSREQCETGLRILSGLTASARAWKTTEMTPEGNNTVEGFYVHWDDVFEDVAMAASILEKAVELAIMGVRSP